MKKDSEKTRQKLLAAAMAEFSEHGIAGGRVDRIAKLAGCNKQLIYAYFESKEGLFYAVYDHMVARILENVQFDPRDLPGYVARLCACYQRHPETLRMQTWYRLEVGTARSPESIDQSTVMKIAAIREAQEGGAVNKRFDPEGLFAIITSLAAAGALPSRVSGNADAPPEVLYKDIVEAVKLLIT